MRRIVPTLLATATLVAVPASAGATSPWRAAVRASPIGEPIASDAGAVLDARGTTLLVAARGGAGGLLTTRFRAPGGRIGPASLVPATASTGGVKVAGDARGDEVLVWIAYGASAPSTYRVYADFRPAGGTFGGPVPLTPTTTTYLASAYAAVDARGNAVVVWSQAVAGIQQVVLSQRGAGGAWSSPVPISAATTGSGASPDTQTSAGALAFDAAGGLCVTWSQAAATTAFQVMLRCRPHGGGFGAIATLSRNGDHSYRQYLAVDPAGNALVAWWNDGDSPAGDAFTVDWRLRTAAGVVGPLRRVPDSSASDPAIAARARGRFDLFWTAGDLSEQTRLAEVVDGAPGVAASLGQVAQNVDTAVVAADGSGHAAAVWTERPATGPTRVELTVLRPHAPRLTHVVGMATAAIGNAVTLDAAGDVLASWADAPIPILAPRAVPAASPSALFVAGYDRAAPLARVVTVPRRTVVGRRVRLRVAARDVFGPVRVTWRFGDGGLRRGASVRHVWRAAGRYRVVLQLLDGAGNRRRLVRTVTVR